MKPWNKNNLIDLGVMAAVGVTIFVFCICIWFACKAGGWWSIFIPGVAVGYACVTFWKKYYIKDVFTGDTKPEAPVEAKEKKEK